MEKIDDQPLVSVLMGSYNAEKFIKEAIESVLASSYKNFEFIICDDVSVDNTVAIVRSYAEKDDRIRVYINEKNLGDYPNRNQAASYARGKYLKYVDHDDIIYPYSLQIMVEDIEKFPEVTYAFCGNEIQDYKSPYPVLYSSEEAFRVHFFEKGGLLYAGGVGSIIRRSAFEQVGRFSGKRFVGDMELWMKLTLVGPILKIQPGLIWWRVHPGQESDIGVKRDLLLRYNVNKEILENKDCPLSDKQKKTALGNYRRLLGRKILLLMFKDFDFSTAISLARGAEIGPVSLFVSLLPVNKLKKSIKI